MGLVKDDDGGSGGGSLVGWLFGSTWMAMAVRCYHDVLDDVVFAVFSIFFLLLFSILFYFCIFSLKKRTCMDTVSVMDITIRETCWQTCGLLNAARMPE